MGTRSMATFNQDEIVSLTGIAAHSELHKHGQLRIAYPCGNSEIVQTHTQLNESRYRISVETGRYIQYSV